MLQLWLNLPKKDRWASPRVQDLPVNLAPTVESACVRLKLYSGTLLGVTSPVQNYTPMIVADIVMDAGASTALQIPANYNTFLYVIEGGISVGEEPEQLNQDEVGWLDLFSDTAQSELMIAAREKGGRFVLYAGQPTGDNIVSYGPFIADNPEEIQDLYKQYRKGKFDHISAVPDSQRISF